MMGGISNNDKAEIAKLAEFILAQSTDADYFFAFMSVGNPDTGLNIDSNRVLISVSSSDDASK